MLRFGFTGLLFEPQSSWMEKALLGRSVAFSGSVGCCGSAHDSQRLECAEELRAVRRALHVPCLGADKPRESCVF